MSEMCKEMRQVTIFLFFFLAKALCQMVKNSPSVIGFNKDINMITGIFNKLFDKRFRGIRQDGKKKPNSAFFDGTIREML